MRKGIAALTCATKQHPLTLCMCSVILLLAGLPASGNPGRGVYANGQVHKVSIDISGHIQIETGFPVNGIFTLAKDESGNTIPAVVSAYQVCRTLNKAPGEGLAVFNNQIFYAYTADTACGQTGRAMSAFVAAFDLRTRQWVSNRAVGTVHVDNYAQGSTSGAAITVFDNRLYLFTDSGVYTSGDGSAWTGPYRALEGSDYQPLDAVSIYPPDAAFGGGKILIVYGVNGTGGTANTYDNLWAAIWSGKLPTPYPAPVDDYYAFPLMLFPGPLPIQGRVSLLPGTATALGWGNKAPSVQLFANIKTSSAAGSIRHLEYTYDRWPGSWRVDPVLYPDRVKYPGTASGSVADFWVYPTSVVDCVFLPEHQALRQIINIQWKDGSTSRSFTWGSDALVPQNRDTAMSCGAFGGTETDTGAADPDDPDALAIRQHYWTLLGVVLGSPPFWPNGLTEQSPLDFKAIADLSNLTYGKSENEAVEHSSETSHQLMLAAGGSVRTGFPMVYSDKFSVDMEFKHTWEASNKTTSTTEIKTYKTMGTADESLGELGKWGWALFSVPVMVVQNWEAYGWDYDADDGTGTRLNQTLHTVEAKPNSNYLKQISFELANPGGIMAGMAPFAESTNLDYWYRGLPYNWQALDPRWSTKLAAAPLTYSAGSGSDHSIATKAEKIESKGSTQEINITAGYEMSVGTKLNGFSLYAKAGYDGVWKTDVTNTTGFGTEVAASLHMKSCEVPMPGCVDELTVQPYWLEASAPAAPWIPTAFKNQLPWCIAWRVTDIRYAPSAPLLAGARAATGLAPLNASGRIVNGTGGGEQGGGPDSHYSIRGGRLAWVDASGVETRIPMTADEFVPSMGVSLEVNGLSWSSLTAKGAWHRSGNVWTFQPDGSVRQNRVMLKLDFGGATYDLQVQKADLNGRVLAGSTNTQLVLAINDEYTFYTTLHHHIDIAWQWSQRPADTAALHVTSFEGRYNSATESGKMSLAGTLPANLPAFGDMGIEINGRPYVAELITMDGFQQAFQSGGVFKYAKEGLILSLDFGNKTWSATFNNQAFHALIAPHLGTVRTRILVGGSPWLNTEQAVVNYSANLTLRK